MNILLNASTVKFGGGLTEVINLLTALAEENITNIKFILVAPKGVGYEMFTDSFKIEWVPDELLKHYKRSNLDKKWMRQLVSREKIDLVFTLGNLPVNVKVKQAVFFDNPFTTTQNLKQLGFSYYERLIHKLRNYIFYKRLKNTNLIFAQTELQKTKLLQKVKDIPVKILENSPTIFKETSLVKNFKIDAAKKRLLCFTRYYPHKNLEILLKVAALIVKEKRNYQIILTVEKDQHPRAEKLIDIIENGLYKDAIVNIGKIQRNEIYSLYQQVDALLLPTLLESFSTTYVDSMVLGKPILTSNLDFAREVCGDAALYFNPYDEQDILNTIEQLFSDNTVLEEKINKGKEQLVNFRTWNELAKEAIETLKQL